MKKTTKKVIFIEPMAATNVFSHYITIPMLGPVYLATIANEAGIDVSILNENILGRKLRSDEIADADILCLSCMTATVERGKEIAWEYKNIRKIRGLESHTIIGGIHASMIPDDVVNDFDQVFIGEAETKIVDLLNGELNDKIVHGEPLVDLDSLPTPNFKLIKGWRRIKTLPIMTSRGCPYNCTFCSVTEMFGRGYRNKSVDRIIDEIIEYNTKQLFFVDDHFVVNKKHTRNLLDKMESNNIKLKWSCQLRSDVSRDKELVAIMKARGCKTVFIGFESINPETLKELKKNQTVEDIRNAVRVFKRNNIGVHGMFMLGGDKDDKDVFKATSEFCRSSGLSSVQYLILTPLPGTEFYRRIESEGRLLHKNWQFYDALHVVFEPKKVSPEELQQAMIDCFNDFYTYTSALNDAISIFFQTIDALLKSIVKKVNLPSFEPSFIKVFGKHIVKKWVQFNRPYLGYLRILSLGKGVKLAKETEFSE